MPYTPLQPSSSKLFAASDLGWENSSLQAGFAEWRDYSYCYRRAADELAKRFPMPLDSPEAMFLPVLFLYRHAVEAALKGILVELSVRSGTQAVIPGHHRIDEIWCAVGPQVEGLPGGLGSAWFARADVIIAELCQVDPNSMYFRYPASKSGAPLLQAGFTLNVTNIATTLQDLFYVLDNIAGYLSAANDFDVDTCTPPA